MDTKNEKSQKRDCQKKDNLEYDVWIKWKWEYDRRMENFGSWAAIMHCIHKKCRKLRGRKCNKLKSRMWCMSGTSLSQNSSWNIWCRMTDFSISQIVSIALILGMQICPIKCLCKVHFLVQSSMVGWD